MLAINPPNQSDTRSSVADWLELSALTNLNGVCTRGNLLSALDIIGDDSDLDSVDPETGEILDDSILEDARHRFVESTFEEIEYRKRILGESYPFSVDAAKFRISLPTGMANHNVGQLVYLFCLLTSAIREQKLTPDKALDHAEHGIARRFQICACMAAGGYLKGDVSSFGFPRASGSGFLPALRDTFSRFGAGKVRDRDDVPEGLPTKIKDAGIDIIAWKDHPDSMPGKSYLIGQCASGIGWRDKSVVDYISQFHGAWFSQPPATHSQPAMFIPFHLHFDLDETNGNFLEVIKTKFWFDEMRFGIIFDRIRIAYFANQCDFSDKQLHARVEGTEHFEQVSDWVRSTCELVGGQS